MLVAISTVDVAFVSAIAAAIGAGAGLLSAIAVLWLAPKTRQHERELARDERLYAELRAAYAEYLEQLYVIQEATRDAQPRPVGQFQGPPQELAQLVTPDRITAYRHAAVG